MRKQETDDDGRTIADMNVEGMPWYIPKEERPGEESSPRDSMDDTQLRMYRWAAVKAGLFVALIFGGVFALFLAFCDFVWFR